MRFLFFVEKINRSQQAAGAQFIEEGAGGGNGDLVGFSRLNGRGHIEGKWLGKAAWRFHCLALGIGEGDMLAVHEHFCRAVGSGQPEVDFFPGTAFGRRDPGAIPHRPELLGQAESGPCLGADIGGFPIRIVEMR